MNNSKRQTIYEALGREPVHPFPARMAPDIVLEVLGNSKKPLRVLDPMMGSGTVLAVARARGHKAFGVDIDPLAVLIARVWTTTIDQDEVHRAAKMVMIRAQAAFKELTVRDAYPRYANRSTREFVRYWFDNRARRQLTAIANCISRVRNSDVRDVLWCAFSRLIIVKQAGASLAMDLAHSRPHKTFSVAPAKPFDKFLSSVDRVLANCIQSSEGGRGPATIVKIGDARNLLFRSSSFDLVVTSPPYLNAIDYMRCSKFSLVWMGFNVDELRTLRGASVGAERRRNSSDEEDTEIEDILRGLKLKPALNKRDRQILARYIGDMRKSISEAARMLRPGGRAVYVVGENTVKGTYIRNSVIVSKAGEIAGLRLCERSVRNLPANRRYLPPPKKSRCHLASLDTRMRHEVILVFQKAA